MPVYATVDDLEDELSGSATPDRPDRLLALASTVVDLMLAGTVYTVGPSGMPDQPEDQNLLRRLTVLQAIWMSQDPDGLQDDFTDMRTTTVSVRRPGSRSRFSPRAVEYLASAGFPGQGMVVYR
jgi:hypothetical protein